MKNDAGQMLFDLLGGARFIIETGAKDLLADPMALRMRLPKDTTTGGGNFFRIVREQSGTYRLTLYRVAVARAVAGHADAVTVLDDRSGVPLEEVRSTFEAITGIKLPKSSSTTIEA